MKRIKDEKEAMKKKIMEKGQLENIDEEVISADGTKKRVKKKKKREGLDAWEGGGDKNKNKEDDKDAKKAKKLKKKEKDESKKYYEIREKDGNIIKVIRKVKKIKYNVGDKDEKVVQELPSIKSSSPEKKKRVILRGGFNINVADYENGDLGSAQNNFGLGDHLMLQYNKYTQKQESIKLSDHAHLSLDSQVTSPHLNRFIDAHNRLQYEFVQDSLIVNDDISNVGVGSYH